jgi:flagellar protein FlaG
MSNYDLFIPPAVVEGRDSAAQRAWSNAVSAAATRVDRPALRADAAVRTPRELASDPLTTEEVTNAVAAFNDVFQQADVSVRYRIDDATDDLVISLVNADTEEVIRQMPPEAILKMRQRLEELLGIIFDTTA